MKDKQKNLKRRRRKWGSSSLRNQLFLHIHKRLHLTISLGLPGFLLLPGLLGMKLDSQWLMWPSQGGQLVQKCVLSFWIAWNLGKIKYVWVCKVDFVKEQKELQNKIRRSMCQETGPQKRGQIIIQLQMAIMTKNEETEVDLHFRTLENKIQCL